MITGLEPIAIKWAIGHVSHALAAKEAMGVQHPLYTATNMAVNHGIASAATSIRQPCRPRRHHAFLRSCSGGKWGGPEPRSGWNCGSVVHAGSRLAHRGQAGRTGGRGGGGVPDSQVRAVPAGEGRRSELLNEVKDVEDLDDLKDLVSGLAILARIRNQSA